MSEAEARPTNFIRQIIDEDLATVNIPPFTLASRRSRTVICTLAMQNPSA